jgi:hypothetical protein
MLQNKYFTASSLELQDKDTLSLENIVFHTDIGPYKCGMTFNVGCMYTFLDHNECRMEMYTVDFRSNPVKHQFKIL